MRLTTKFAVLLGCFIMTVGVSLAFAGWSVHTLDRELTHAYDETTLVLDRLDAMKRAFEANLSIIGIDHRQEIGRFDQAQVDLGRLDLSAIDGPLEMLDKSKTPALSKRAGEGAANAILARSNQVRNEIDVLVSALANSSADAEHPAQLRTQLQKDFRSLHDLIERAEGQLLSDIAFSGQYGREVKSLLVRVLVICAAVSVLAAGLALMLFQRWVLQPVKDVRQATGEIAAGRYEYRIPVRSADEMGALAGEVNQMAGRIVDIQKQLIERERLAAVGELTRRIAHNLRNPLAGIRNLAELSRDEVPADSETAENQRRIVTAVDRFEAWLSELLNATRPLELSLDWHSPARLLQQVLDAHLPLAAGRKIRLEMDVSALPEQARFDASNLEHAIVSLASNALEATPAGGRVRVIGRMEMGTPPGTLEQWQVIVEDSGPGVAPELADRIFLPHFTTKKHGTGTGLAIVQNVVAAHGGRVRVDRSELGGAAFVVTLPVDAAASSNPSGG